MDLGKNKFTFGPQHLGKSDEIKTVFKKHEMTWMLKIYQVSIQYI